MSLLLWLQDNFNVIEGGRRVNEQKLGRLLVAINDDFIEFPHQIRAWSRHAQNAPAVSARTRISILSM